MTGWLALTTPTREFVVMKKFVVVNTFIDMETSVPSPK